MEASGWLLKARPSNSESQEAQRRAREARVDSAKASPHPGKPSLMGRLVSGGPLRSSGGPLENVCRGTNEITNYAHARLTIDTATTFVPCSAGRIGKENRSPCRKNVKPYIHVAWHGMAWHGMVNDTTHPNPTQHITTQHNMKLEK